jgi:hypothetical protein
MLNKKILDKEMLNKEKETRKPGNKEIIKKNFNFANKEG